MPPDVPARPAEPAAEAPAYSFTYLPNPDDDQGPPRWPGRRRFLVASGIAAATAAAGTLAGRELITRRNVSQARAALRFPRPAVSAPPLPAGSNLNIPGLSSFITSNDSFYRVDTALLLPQVDPATWQLRIHGMVQREITITFADLLKRPLIEDYVTLTCVSDPVGGPYVGNAKWLGASLAALIRQARPLAGASQLLCTSVDGFTSGTPLEVVLDGRDALLAVAMNGEALPVEHGFPARMVVPGLYGYVSATKWVTDIEVTTFAAASAYWVQRGWSQQAPIKTESRIDVPAGGASLAPGRTPVAGVAWAQHKGIAAVEVRVDGGPWHEARLAAVPDIDTWRQWVWEWPATPGNHLLEARATDQTGYTQTATQAQPPPERRFRLPLRRRHRPQLLVLVVQLPGLGAAPSTRTRPSSHSLVGQMQRNGGEMSADAEFAGLAREYLDDRAERHPDIATGLGDHRFDARLADPSAQALDEERRALDGWAARLAAIDRDTLSAEHRVDAAMMADSVARRVFEIDELREHTWNPLQANPGRAIYQLLARDFAPLPDRLGSVAARLAAIPAVLAEARRQLGRMPRVHLETAIGQFDGTIALVSKEIDAALEVAGSTPQCAAQLARGAPRRPRGADRAPVLAIRAARQSGRLRRSEDRPGTVRPQAVAHPERGGGRGRDPGPGRGRPGPGERGDR